MSPLPAVPLPLLHAPPRPPLQGFYPLNYLVAGGVSRPAPGPAPGDPLPSLRLVRRGPAPAGVSYGAANVAVERLELELDTGKGGAWGVLNITAPAPVLRWSLSDRVAITALPEVRVIGAAWGVGGGFWVATQVRCGRLVHGACPRRQHRLPHPTRAPNTLQGHGVAHMVRFAGNLHARQYTFWLDVPAGRPVGVRLFVKWIEESGAAAGLLAQLPDWASPAAVVCFQSLWAF